MMKRLLDSTATRMVKARRHRAWRVAVNRAAATVALGAALSIGGATEALQGVHFFVQKDLDSVRVVKSDGRHAEVVANLNDGFAANSVFKLSRVLPERVVTQQISLFNEQWLPRVETAGPAKTDLFHTEMAKINTVIRQNFFANAVPFGDLIHQKAQKYDVDP